MPPASSVLKAQLFASLGRRLIETPPPREARLAVLNDVGRWWQTRAHVADHYECAAAFVELAVHPARRRSCSSCSRTC